MKERFGLSLRAHRALFLKFNPQQQYDVNWEPPASEVSQFTHKELARLPNVGLGTVAEIENWLNERSIIHGLPYRLQERPSTYREMRGQEGAMISYLRKRGWRVERAADE